MDNIIKRLKPKAWLYLITMTFMILGCLSLPSSMSAPLMFIRYIEPGAIEFFNTFSLLAEILVSVILVGLWIGMLAIISMVINIQFKEIAIFLLVSSIIAYIFIGVPGLFVLGFLYYCWETRNFSDKVKVPDPRLASAMGMTMTFIIIGLLGGLIAARGDLYFEPETLDFAQSFGKVWIGCNTTTTVRDCIPDIAKKSTAYNLLVKNCQSTADPQSCLSGVEATLQSSVEQIQKQYEQLGDINKPIGEFTTIILAQQLNTWVGLMPEVSKLILGLIAFSLLTLIGFVLEVVVPWLIQPLVGLLVKYELLYVYTKTETTSYLVVLV